MVAASKEHSWRSVKLRGTSALDGGVGTERRVRALASSGIRAIASRAPSSLGDPDCERAVRLQIGFRNLTSSARSRMRGDGGRSPGVSLQQMPPEQPLGILVQDQTLLLGAECAVLLHVRHGPA